MKLSSPFITHFSRFPTLASSWFGMTVTQGTTFPEVSWQIPILCKLSTDLRSNLLRTQTRPFPFKPSKGPLTTLGRKSKPFLWPTKRYRIASSDPSHPPPPLTRLPSQDSVATPLPQLTWGSRPPLAAPPGSRLLSDAFYLRSLSRFCRAVATSHEKVAESCPTLCNPTDCIVHGIL